MPTPLKHSENQRKHLTRAELSARQAAEASLAGGGRKFYLRAPAWLSKDARAIFQVTKKRLSGFDLLEPIDVDMLALYADAVARYQVAVKRLTAESEPREIQAVQAWSRIALTYADKLGFSQTARARLARRKALDAPPDDMEQLLADVSEYVNGSGA